MISIKIETDLTDFKFWSGAKSLSDKLTNSELEQISQNLNDNFIDKLPTDSEINDLFWHESEFICELIGLDIEEVLER